MKKHIVFIVDDDGDDREIARDAFKAYDTEADYVLLASGDALLQQLQQQPEKPSLVLLDLNMPGMDGREVLKVIKSNPLLQAIPIVIFTTSSSPLDRKITYELGANCFVTKPDTYEKMVEVSGCIGQLWLPRT